MKFTEKYKKKIRERIQRKTTDSEVNFFDGTPCKEWQGCCDSLGYGRVVTSVGGVKTYWYVHRIAMFINEPFDLEWCVLHRCDNPKCCNILHLFIGSYADNSSDMINKSRQHKGETHYLAKLTEEDVLRIRANKEGWSQGEWGRYFGVHQAAINAIIHRKNWKHI